MRKTKEQISHNMRQIRSVDSEIEIMLRKELWARGLRYRKNCKTVFGKPDIAFIGKKVSVCCDGEFWHGYDWENRKKDIRSNREFWIAKIERNMARDRQVNETLEKSGWTVLRYWGRDIRKNLSQCADEIERILAEKTEKAEENPSFRKAD